jgi:hypothetical protein
MKNLRDGAQHMNFPLKGGCKQVGRLMHLLLLLEPFLISRILHQVKPGDQYGDETERGD